jgi:hypothetical protein
MTALPFLKSPVLGFNFFGVFLALMIGSMGSIGCKPAVDVSGESKTAIDASKVCSGTTLLGVAGTAACPTTQALFQSNAYRNLATTQLTMLQEVGTYAGSSGTSASNFPSNYREIPDQNIDDDGQNATGANQFGTRPQVACGGTAILTVANKIADCASKNGANATWDGSTKGTAGQSVWKLVFSSGQTVAGTCISTPMATDCYEVWQDQRTGLLWSSAVTRFAGWDNDFGVNHCLASGNSQNVGINCSVGGSYQYATTPGSICSESTETGGVQAIVGVCNSPGSGALSSGPCVFNFGAIWYDNTLTPTGGQENYSSGNYSIAKGYMGAKSSTPVRWRLPSKSDFLLADLDGIRFVMPDTGAVAGTNGRPSDGTMGANSISTYQWSSTVKSDSRGSGVTMSSLGGSMSSRIRSNIAVVRCVGR